jgi:hypothetical protein
MDPGTGLTVLGLALGSKQLIGKILGPSADYLGTELKYFTEKGVNNLKNIFSNAERKLGDKIEIDGAVPPKVLKGILNEGVFCEDALSAEYFGGVLASSRSGISRDDRGASFIALISRLSTYQIRAHYIFYYVLKKLYDGSDLKIGTDTHKMKVFISYDTFTTAMEFSEGENSGILSVHILNGLRRENFLGHFSYGGQEFLKEGAYVQAPGAGIVLQPTTIGVELFLWAHGKSDLDINNFLFSANKFEIGIKIDIESGFSKAHG